MRISSRSGSTLSCIRFTTCTSVSDLFPLFFLLRCELCVGHNKAVDRMRLVAFHNLHGENPFACVAIRVSLSFVHFVALVSAQADAKCPPSLSVCVRLRKWDVWGRWVCPVGTFIHSRKPRRCPGVRHVEKGIPLTLSTSQYSRWCCMRLSSRIVSMSCTGCVSM